MRTVNRLPIHAMNGTVPAEALPVDQTGAELRPAAAAPMAPLLLTPAEAAKLLAVSPRTLWGLTDKGDVPCVRIGRAVRYAPADLMAYVDRQRSSKQ